MKLKQKQKCFLKEETIIKIIKNYFLAEYNLLLEDVEQYHYGRFVGYELIAKNRKEWVKSEFCEELEEKNPYNPFGR